MLPTIFLARHGETAWSLSGQHTGLTDLPLTPHGEINARRLGERLEGMIFARVLTSPLLRASKTCELSGFADHAEVDPDLVEWDYGQYEGRTTAEIRSDRPNWVLFRDGCPGGESLADVTQRADRVVNKLRSDGRNILVFSSGHFLRVLTARWLGLEATAGAWFHLDTATLSALGYERTLAEPVIQLWNDGRHVLP